MSIVLSRLNIESYEKNANKITVKTNSDSVIYIRAISAKAIEIWVDFNGKGIEPHSYSIEDMPEYGAEIYCADKEEYLFVSAGNAAIRIRKNGIKISLVSTDDKTVICDGNEIGKMTTVPSLWKTLSPTASISTVSARIMTHIGEALTAEDRPVI